MWNKGWGGCDFTYSSSSPGVPQAQPTEMRSVLHIRQQARPRLLRLRRNFKRYQSVPTRTRGGFEKVGGRASVGSVQGGVEQPEEERQQPASPCFERPRQDYHQSGCRVNKLCCACHVFVLCFLSQSSVGLCKTTLPLGKKDFPPSPG